jgi:hypothetical protein
MIGVVFSHIGTTGYRKSLALGHRRGRDDADAATSIQADDDGCMWSWGVDSRILSSAAAAYIRQQPTHTTPQPVSVPAHCGELLQVVTSSSTSVYLLTKMPAVDVHSTLLHTRLFVCGANSHGQLGVGHRNDVREWQEVFLDRNIESAATSTLPSTPSATLGGASP